MPFLRLALLLLVLPIVASAQNTPTLASSFDATSGDLTHTLSGAAADSFSMLFVGRTTGSTTLFRGAFTIDLDPRFFSVPFGRTDANGDLTRTVTLRNPANLTGETVYFQSVTVDASGIMRPAPTTPPTRPTRGRRPGRGGPRPMPTGSLVFEVSNQTSITF